MHRLFAHRGLFDPGEGIPENSMPAFERAVLCGYPIELDVQVTKDNKIVVFHDYTLGRMCGIDLPLETKTYEELQKLSLQNTGEKIPLFSDVLDVYKRQGRYMILKITTFPAAKTSLGFFIFWCFPRKRHRPSIKST